MNTALSPAELRALSGRSNAEGTLRTGIHGVLLISTGWLLAIAGPWTVLPAMIAFGLVQVALFAPAHEATHQTIFASRRANQVVGWLAACPSLLNCSSTPRITSPITGTHRFQGRILNWTWKRRMTWRATSGVSLAFPIGACG
jgi:hypothetical protein